MTLEEICVTRVYQTALGTIDRKSITKEEIDVTIEILKKHADERNDWNDHQKKSYKVLADYAKEKIKRTING